VGLDDRRAAIFRRFRDLVEEHFADHWAVNDFARQLHVTESRLDRICRALAGKSAFEMAHDRVMLEARRRLVHLPMPVNALAYELGFEDPAYFCRAFKRCTGLTPSAFRKSQRAQMGLEG
jgi:AraC family transcriptional activator of pobA